MKTLFHSSRIAGAFAVHAADMIGAAQVIALLAQVDMDLGARAAGTGLRHLPEVFLAPKEQHMRRVEAGLLLPDIRGFIIAWDVALVVLETGGVEFILGQSPHIGEQLPGPGNGFLFVVIAKDQLPSISKKV